MNKGNIKPLIALLLIVSGFAAAQPTNQDCPNAIPICQPIYVTNISYSGEGNITGEINNVISCLNGEKNDVWYTFTVTASGNLNFTITPNNPADDYDWAVYNLTNSICADIVGNPSLEVSCNFSGNAGCGGATGPNGNTGGACGAQNEPVIPVVAGQTYVINVSNFSATQSGYTIDFTASTASIFDNIAPQLSTISSLSCGTNTVNLFFSENIMCNSVSPSDFTLTGPGGPYTVTAVSSVQCASGAPYGRDFQLTFSPGISQAGNYTFSIVSPVQDVCANLLVVPHNVLLPVAGITVTANYTDVTCPAGTDGTATVNITSGTGPFNYQWSPNVSSGSSATGLTAGTYTVTVSSASGCPVSTTINITEPAAWNVVHNIMGATCSVSNGFASLTVSGATSPYTYQWNPSGGTGSSASNLAAGAYTITITDNLGCTHNHTLNVQTVTTLNAQIGNVQNVTCFGQNNGSITLNVSGGSGTYVFQWSPNVSSTNVASNLSPGLYTVSVIDGACLVVFNSISITQPASALGGNIAVTQPTCNNNNGSATMNVNGGVPPYSYQWNGGGTSQAISSLGSGNYTVTVTDDNGCVITQSCVVSPANGQSVTVNYINQTVTCFGQSNGSLTLNISGGTAPFNYQWSNGLPSTQNQNNLAAGIYTVTVTDQTGCAVTTNATINTPPQLTIQQNSVQNVLCFGLNTGSASVIAAGGTGTLSYQWSSAGGTSASAANLLAGTYTITVTDVNLCMASVNIVIAQPASALQAVLQATATTCGNTNGSVAAVASGGTAPYSYSWSNAATAPTINSLIAGTYTVTVTDDNSCTYSTSSSVSASTAPQISSVNVSNVSCFGMLNGSVSVNVINGTAPYSYLWSNGGSITNTISNLTPGNYSVTVTDNSNCTVAGNAAVTTPAQIQIQFPVVQNVLCYGDNTGSITANVSGGSGVYTYTWSGSGSISNTAINLQSGIYTITVTDNSGCIKQDFVAITQPASALSLNLNSNSTSCGLNNGSSSVSPAGGTAPYTFLWSNSLTGNSISNLAAGSYSVTVTDANGCVLNQNVNIAISSPVVISNVAVTHVLCNGDASGSVSLTVNGGILPYTYVWSNGNTQANNNNLSAGSYIYTVTDAAGCVVSNAVQINQPSAILISTSPSQTVCKNQPVLLTASASGGVAPYQYLWNTGSTNDSVTVSNSATANYTVTVTDANGCAIVSNPVSIAVFPLLSVLPVADTSICENTSVSISVTAQGGNGVYQYNWGSGAGSSAAATFNPLSDTSVSVTVTDGCAINSVTETLDIHLIPVPLVNFSFDNNKGCQNLTVNFSDSSSSIAGASYLWNFGDGGFSTDTNPSHNYTTVGNYNVSLTLTTPLPQQCAVTFTNNNSITILEMPVASFAFTPERPTVLSPVVNFNNQSSFANNFQWNFGDGHVSTEANPENYYQLAGNYMVTLIAFNDSLCSDTISETVTIDEEYALYIPLAFTPNGDGLNDLLQVYGTWIDEFAINVYDRWGNLVTESSSLPFAWEGKDASGKVLAQGTYVYTVKTKDLSGARHAKKGFVTLVK